MSLIQLFILVVVLAVWWRLYARLKASELTTVEFVEWFLLWAVVAIVALVPSVSSRLAAFVGVGRGSDLVTYLALLLAFYLLFKLFMKIERVERQLTQLTRTIALTQAEPKPKSADTPKPPTP